MPVMFIVGNKVVDGNGRPVKGVTPEDLLNPTAAAVARTFATEQVNESVADGPQKPSELPSNFPHRELLGKLRVTSITQILEMGFEGLKALRGVGPAKATEINNAALVFAEL